MPDDVDNPEPSDEPTAGDPPKPPEGTDKQAGMVPVGELAAERKKRQALEAKLAELSDREKSELEKLNDNLTDARTKAETSSAKLLQLEVALEAAPEGMSVAQIRKLAKRLSGATRDELLADAEELFGDFGAGRPPKGGPTPTPKGGSDPTDDDADFDADAIAKQILASPW